MKAPYLQKTTAIVFTSHSGSTEFREMHRKFCWHFFRLWWLHHEKVWKRKSFSLHDKQKIFDGFDAEMKRSGKVCIAKLAFSLGLKRTTLSSFLKGRKKTEEYQSQGQSVKRKKSRKCRNQEVNDSLLFWFSIKLSQGIPIDGLMLKEKALQFAKDINTEGPLCRLR